MTATTWTPFLPLNHKNIKESKTKDDDITRAFLIFRKCSTRGSVKLISATFLSLIQSVKWNRSHWIFIITWKPQNVQSNKKFNFKLIELHFWINWFLTTLEKLITKADNNRHLSKNFETKILTKTVILEKPVKSSFHI